MQHQQTKLTGKAHSWFFLSLAVTGLSACGGYGGSDSYDDSAAVTPDSTTATSITSQVNSPGATFSSAIGSIITAQKDGLSLYTFENDRNDVDGDGIGDSDCNGACADIWPPLGATVDSVNNGDFTIITRDDGTTLQWAYKGLPLYFFHTDTAQGDTNGEGVNNVWFVSRPDPWSERLVNDTAQGSVFIGSGGVFGTDGSGGKSGIRSIARDNFTLYTFEGDRNDKDGDGFGDSDCNAACAEIWPPLFAEKGATGSGDFSVVTRDDGTAQWAFKQLPLYFFVTDANAGDTKGEKVKNVWFVARPDPFKVNDSSIGTLFSGASNVIDVDGAGNKSITRSDRTGFSLYTFDNDVNDTNGDGFGDSDCNDGCAVIWPPLYADTAATGSGNFTIFNRDDGTKQWAYKNEPMYFFANDFTAGDVNGDQVNSIWHAARPAPFQLQTSATLGDIFAARGTISDVVGDGSKATTLADRTGFTVYLFDNDTNDADSDGLGDSDCNSSCAAIWPPVYAESSDHASGDYSLIIRDDNTKQWAYKKSPLYFYVGDASAGDVNGVSVPGWHEVKP